MEKIRFGRSEARVPRVSVGTWAHGGLNRSGDMHVGWGGHSDTDARAALLRAWELGLTHWDTADVYGNGRSEAQIGRLWGDVPRDGIFLASKVGWDAGSYGHYYHPDHMRNQLEASLRNLRTDHIDLYYLHHCNFGPEDRYFEGAAELIGRFRDEGKIRFVGLSDWDSHLLMRFVEAVDPDVVQPYRNVTNDEYEASGLARWVAEHDLGVAFFSPLRHGLLLGKYTEPTTFPEGDFRRNDEGFRDAELLATLIRNRDALRERFSGNPEPVLHGLLGTLLTDSPTGCVLVGMRNVAQVNAAAAAGAALSEEDAAWVRGLYPRG